MLRLSRCSLSIGEGGADCIFARTALLLIVVHQSIKKPGCTVTRHMKVNDDGHDLAGHQFWLRSGLTHPIKNPLERWRSKDSAEIEIIDSHKKVQ